MESKYIKYKTRLVGLKLAKLNYELYNQTGGMGESINDSNKLIETITSELENKALKIRNNIALTEKAFAKNKEYIDYLAIEYEKAKEFIKNKDEIGATMLANENDYSKKLDEIIVEQKKKLEDYNQSITILQNELKGINDQLASIRTLYVKSNLQNMSNITKIEELKEKVTKLMTDLETATKNANASAVPIEQPASQTSQTPEIQTGGSRSLNPNAPPYTPNSSGRNKLKSSTTRKQQQVSPVVTSPEVSGLQQEQVLPVAVATDKGTPAPVSSTSDQPSFTEQIESINEKINNLTSEINKLSNNIQQNSKDINTKSQEADGVYNTGLISIEAKEKSFTERLNKLTEEFKERQLKFRNDIKEIVQPSSSKETISLPEPKPPSQAPEQSPTGLVAQRVQAIEEQQQQQKQPNVDQTVTDISGTPEIKTNEEGNKEALLGGSTSDILSDISVTEYY